MFSLCAAQRLCGEKNLLRDWFYHRGHREHREGIKSILCFLANVAETQG
ncbi:MAG: hypothetical protein OFPII_32580 [Osedax symbiont Rs1]|nr:MAG: hypothetical protein OFPII_32580 [Osedax symbiont Rs1]